MSILRIGSTKKYAQGWELAFGRKSDKPTEAVKKRTLKKQPKKKRSG
jgi:hypothetical protein